MAWTPLLLVLLSHCTGRDQPRGPGSLSQPVLTQPPSLSTSLGASARLTCTLSSGYSVASYTIYWYRQKPGSPPRYLLRFRSDSDKHKGSGIPSRFSGSKDASANAGLLLISGLQPEDEDDYSCGVGHSSGSSYHSHSVSDEEEVRQKPLGPQTLALSRFSVRSFCGGICKGGFSAPRSL
ncbi:hypothetical protein J1605_015377 [Eschrichtius robustus]|uniref:Ig-like domain-containing protein n=1 Tax=Eschrichtius robustus TaxID=9764 RepID=A0AB34GBM9_ESCRO|nr:hypothetical protein J1605_015377 [Eschrichtius robustus]